MTEPLRLTYRELGGRLGISPDAARMKAKREAGKAGSAWRLIPGNHPSDPVHVELPADALPERPPLPRADALAIAGLFDPPSPPTLPDAPKPTKEGTDDVLARFAITLHGELSAANRKLLEETAAHGETKARLAGAEAARDRAQDVAGELQAELLEAQAERDEANAYVEKAARALHERGKSRWTAFWHGFFK